jgi:hypothetical protein
MFPKNRLQPGCSEDPKTSKQPTNQLKPLANQISARWTNRRISSFGQTTICANELPISPCASNFLLFTETCKHLWELLTFAILWPIKLPHLVARPSHGQTHARRDLPQLLRNPTRSLLADCIHKREKLNHSRDKTDTEQLSQWKIRVLFCCLPDDWWFHLVYFVTFTDVRINYISWCQSQHNLWTLLSSDAMQWNILTMVQRLTVAENKAEAKIQITVSRRKIN